MPGPSPRVFYRIGRQILNRPVVSGRPKQLAVHGDLACARCQWSAKLTRSCRDQSDSRVALGSSGVTATDPRACSFVVLLCGKCYKAVNRTGWPVSWLITLIHESAVQLCIGCVLWL